MLLLWSTHTKGTLPTCICVYVVKVNLKKILKIVEFEVNPQIYKVHHQILDLELETLEKSCKP